jgi:hypothetical protein
MVYFLSIISVVIFIYFLNIFILLPLDVKKFKKLIEEKKYQQAERIYQKRLINQEVNYIILNGLALIYENKKEWHLAIYEYGRMLNLNQLPPQENEITIRLRKINIHQQVKQYKEIADECYLILKKDPFHLFANLEIGKRLFDLKNYKAAKFYLMKIEQKHNIEGLQMLLDIEIHEKEYQKALEIIEQIKKASNQKDIGIIFKYITINYYLKTYETIIQTYENINPNIKIPKKIMIIYGISQYKNNNLGTAKVIFDKSLKLYFNDHSKLIILSRYYYVDILLLYKELSQAIEQSKFINQVDPDYLDNSQRNNLLEKLNQDDFLSKLFELNKIEFIAEQILKFDFSNNFYINNKSIKEKNHKNDLNNSWFIIKMVTSSNKIFYLFFSFNHKFLTDVEIDEIILMIREKNDIKEKINLIVLSLFGFSAKSKKRIVDEFENVYFYFRNDFIFFLKNKSFSFIFKL